MKKIAESFMQGGLVGITAVFVIVVSGVTYAAWNDVVSNGEPLTASSWNGLVEHSVPSGAVMAFDLGACPSGWTEFSALRSRVIVGVGQSAGLSDYTLGQTGGDESVTLTVGQIPSHSHSPQIGVTSEDASSNDPTGKIFASAQMGGGGTGVPLNYANESVEDFMHTSAIASSSIGGGLAHENRPPYYALRYCKKD